ncbi:transcriptional regulator [Mycolicibacterium fluoranthenivorans]|jgi:DNA-binding MarR family transcriptional regulator|uniref:Winged helix DNA-binding domain-containing protein n=1 Tax=Mycolicibacterium fluoranthenivorans TaxID=258505 RepID=A0A1G4WCG2_9MYCO|nr:transcriptional regulator [Mycolicibacterium fluoranthenivorans]SCX20335.1 Winged helix DNA-binding domain-containing protein [Mycolicibacterium fluoranthenivorans]
MPEPARFDELIHPSTRLTLVATLAAADWAEFGYLKERAGLSDSALSKQLTILEEAGYLHTERRLEGSRHRVRARLTDAGRHAYLGHIAALNAIVSGRLTEPQP